MYFCSKMNIKRANFCFYNFIFNGISFMKLKPIGANILVKPTIETEKKSFSGIYIETKQKEPPKEGVVMELGNDVEEGLLKVGDKIIFKMFAPDSIEVDGEEYLIMTSDAILGVINEVK